MSDVDRWPSWWNAYGDEVMREQFAWEHRWVDHKKHWAPTLDERQVEELEDAVVLDGFERIGRDRLRCSILGDRGFVSPAFSCSRYGKRADGSPRYEAWSYGVDRADPPPVLVIRRVRGALVRVVDLDGDPYSEPMNLTDAMRLLRAAMR